MIETQTNAHHVLMNGLSSSSSSSNSKAPNLQESCKRNDMMMHMNNSQIDTAAPFESVKDAVSKFKGLVKFEDRTDMNIEDMLKLNAPGGGTGTSTKMTRSESGMKYIPNTVGQIDTAAPIESVKAAVNKFGRTEKAETLPPAPTLERQKSITHELEKLQEEVDEQRKESEAAEETKGHVLEELEATLMVIEELKRSLEKAESQASQAQQEFWLAQQNVGATELKIARSAASWSKLQDAKGRVADELSSAMQELQSMEDAHAAAVSERNEALRKAEEYASESTAMERTMENLMLEIDGTKQSTELTRLACAEAKQQKDAAAAEFELEKSSWEMELKRAEDELAKLDAGLLAANDLKSMVANSSASLRSLRAELSSVLEAKAARTMEVEKAMRRIKKTSAEIESLKSTAAPLRSALETERSTMDATRKREASSSASAQVLGAAIESVVAEIELVLRREEEAKMKAEGLPETLNEAKEEVNQAKSAAKSASEALKKAEEEAAVTKAEAATMAKRLDAAHKEVQAAKASATMANSTASAMKESKHTKRARKNGVTLSTEDYLELRRKAAEAEETAKNRLTAAIEQVKQAKESESRRQQELEEAEQAIHERKRGVQLAADITERTDAERAMAEQELRETTTPRHEVPERKPIIAVRSLSGPVELRASTVSAAASGGFNSPRIPAGCRMARSNTMITVGDVAKHTKRKSKSFLPMISTLIFCKRMMSTTIISDLNWCDCDRDPR